MLQAAEWELVRKLELADIHLRPLDTSTYLSSNLELNNINAIHAGDVLVITVVFPLISLKNNFYLYAIENVGTHIPSNTPTANYSQQGLTRVADIMLPDYIAVSADNEYFVNMDARAAHECLHVSKGICSQLSIFHTVLAARDCVSSIFMDDTMNIKSKCQFDIFPHRIVPPCIRYVAAGVYLVSNIGDHIQFKCRSGPRELAVPTQALVHVPCGCFINMPLYKSQPSAAQCPEGQLPSLRYMVPVAYLLHFNMTHVFNFSALTQTFPNPVTVRIPDISTYLQRMYKSGKTSPDFKIPIDEFAKFDSLQKVEESLPLLPLATVGERYFTWFSIFDFALLTMLIMLAVFTGILHKRVTIATTSLHLMASRTEAAHITPPTTPGATLTPLFVIHDTYMDIVVITVSVAVTLYCVMRMICFLRGVIPHKYAWYKRMPFLWSPPQKCHKLHFYLRLAAPQTFAIVYLSTIETHAGITEVVRQPTCALPALEQGCVSKYLSIPWTNDELIIMTSDIKRVVEMPRRVSISPKLADKLMSIVVASPPPNITLLCRNKGDTEYWPVKSRAEMERSRLYERIRDSESSTEAPRLVRQDDHPPMTPPRDIPLDAFIYPQPIPTADLCIDTLQPSAPPLHPQRSTYSGYMPMSGPGVNTNCPSNAQVIEAHLTETGYSVPRTPPVPVSSVAN